MLSAVSPFKGEKAIRFSKIEIWLRFLAVFFIFQK
jgi:hypothetical protein